MNEWHTEDMNPTVREDGNKDRNRPTTIPHLPVGIFVMAITSSVNPDVYFSDAG